MESLPAHIDEYEDLLTKNRIWMARTQGIGILSAEDAIAMGVSGPLLRGSGVAYDVRKAFPYSSYEEFDFDVPTQTEGDCYARYLVRRGGNARKPEDRPAGDGEDSGGGADSSGGAGNHSAVARGDEDLDRRPDLPFQNFHRGIRAAAGRGLSGD